MSQAISFWALEVPAGEGPTPMISDIPRHSTTVRITMAAIDPTAAPLNADEPLRTTLKIMRRAPDADDYDMSDDEDEEEEDEEEESEDEAPKDKNGKKLSKKEADAAVKKALKIAQENAEKMEVDEDDDEEDEELEDGDFEVEEFTLCTLDPKNHYQQTLDLTIDEDDEIFFKVIGNFDVSLSGNYMVPPHDHDHDHDEEDYSDSEGDSDYDLSPDEDELYGAGSDDDLDDVPNPRITEVESEEEKTPKKGDKKSLKRAAEEPAKEEAKPEVKLSKKQLKKLKANDGKAVDATAETPDKKSVKFAEKLEQGPTGSAEKPKAEKPKAEKKKEEKPKPTSTVVQGVVIEDKKIGSGALAKNGARLGMRYIGKLQNGKTFDSNTKGKPFNFKLGRGEVIKGWDVGLAGMRIGGERRLTIPPNMAYGKQANAGIPANSTLIFDVKLLEVK